MRENEKIKKKIEPYNTYFKQLCLTGLALIWLFTDGIFQNGNKYLFYSFMITILGLVLDFIIQTIDVLFNLKFSNLITRIIVFIQFAIILFLFSSIGYFFLSSELTLLPENSNVGS